MCFSTERRIKTVTASARTAGSGWRKTKAKTMNNPNSAICGKAAK